MVGYADKHFPSCLPVGPAADPKPRDRRTVFFAPPPAESEGFFRDDAGNSTDMGSGHIAGIIIAIAGP
jgi:hypothetical protein